MKTPEHVFNVFTNINVHFSNEALGHRPVDEATVCVDSTEAKVVLTVSMYLLIANTTPVICYLLKQERKSVH